ncbi:hypothetical protein CFOL_v3_21804 [Cephalotus follicularis]|uniref:Nuclear pore complex protein NUP1-like n=1 Tax=Cephalotus follicularis TaxID=3775 RepID=A0A1Q3CDK9_CEPFO|nr:hypothetical protein CFOL_v3_21804 [Cephalotus follicularis]
MATAQEKVNGNPYESGGGGGYGKSRKKPFRSSHHTTPYDRPQIAMRNPSLLIDNNHINSNGWLSKLVNPAQRLITSSAHRLFASVFRKRLPLPPTPAPQPPEPVVNEEARDSHQKTVYSDKKDPNGMQGAATDEHDNQSSLSDQGRLTELEKILRHKTFTRSEIDRLTTLLHSKSVDFPVGIEEKRSEVIPPKQLISRDGKDEVLKTAVKDNGVGSHFTSKHAVLDEDIASPAELAKAYMGSRPSKVCPSMLGLRGQALREDSAALSDRPFPSKTTSMSLVPKPAGRVPENGFVTPRSRGRSAIYSMARSPYTRVQPTATIKGGSSLDAFGGPSSSRSAWEQNRISGSKQVALKRRSSVLENDIGSVGPIRRIRQKSNLPSPKIVSLEASGNPVSKPVIGGGPQQPSSSMNKPVSLGEPKHGFTKAYIEDEDNSFPGTTFTSVPSKSREMATKILQQLDVLVSSREKSPAKLSPSMLRGPALKSLENVDSSNLLENAVRNNKDSNLLQSAQGDNKLDGMIGTSLPDSREYMLPKQSKIEENSHSEFLIPYSRSAPLVNGVGTAGSLKDNVPGDKTMDSAVLNANANSHPQKKRAFQMTAHEDFLVLDDDDHSNGFASTPFAEGREKLDTSVVESKITTEAITMEKPPVLSVVKASSNSLFNQNTDQGSSDSSAIAGKSSIGFTYAAATSPSIITIQSAVVATPLSLTSDKVASSKESNDIPPKFSIQEKYDLSKEANSAIPTISVSSENVDGVTTFAFGSSSAVASESLGPKFTRSSGPTPDSSHSFASIAVGATDSVPKVSESDKADNRDSVPNVPELDKADNRITSKARVVFRTPETAVFSGVPSSSSTASIFSLGTPANSLSLNNGYHASSPSSFSSTIPPLVSNMGTNSGNTTFSTSAAVPSLTSGLIFKFGSSVVPSTSTISAISHVEQTEGKTKDMSFGHLTSTSFPGTSLSFNNLGGTSSVITSTEISIFGDKSSAISSIGSSISDSSSAIPQTGSNVFCGTSTISSTGSCIFGFSAAAPLTATTISSQSQGSTPFSAGGVQVSASTQSMPIQFSSASTPSFGLIGNTAFSSGTSPFGSSSSMSKPFSSGTAFGSCPAISSLESNSVSSSSSSTSTLFGSNWQAPKSPSFASTFNSTSSSAAFPFRASSPSIVASNSTPMVFGTSTGASMGSIFPFISSAATTLSQPVFSSFPFSSAPSGNIDQMNMEDSMAEDTVQTTTLAAPAFGQQSISTPSSFVFGSRAPSGANPFQFGDQQNIANPQNPSPFQISGSLDINAGGSFSLGTGGGDKSSRKFVKVKHKQRKK